MAVVKQAEYLEMMDGEIVDYPSKRMAVLSISARIIRSTVLVILPMQGICTTFFSSVSGKVEKHLETVFRVAVGI